jgi:3-phenylpropionate/trans-cinnamate dioxygenase ferredoxin reductase subunit
MTDAFELVIAGGGPAGFSAAEAYREAGGAGPVAMVAAEGRVPYERPPLTKDLLRGEVGEDEIGLAPASWPADRDVELIAGLAVSLVPARRRLTLEDGRELTYDHCLLATGAEPTRLPVAGASDPAVHVVRSLAHVQGLLTALSADARVTVIGSGFIGCEIAASLRIRGHVVTLLTDEAAPQARRLGEEVGELLSAWLRDDGVRLLAGAGVDRIEPAAGGGVTIVAGPETVAADVVVMAAGIAPRLELAASAGIEMPDDAIPADASMRTPVEGVLAAGDACRAYNVTAGRALRVDHWGDALGQGEVAGQTAAGAEAEWDDVPGFWTTIGARTLKYAAWGDGHDAIELTEHGGGGFTARYRSDGALVGVLTHDADVDYDEGREQIAVEAPGR